MHFSKVRSLTLDTWEPELLKVSEENLLQPEKFKIFLLINVLILLQL